MVKDNKAFFGFKRVSANVKQGLVNHVFNNVSDKYDLMNDVMSFGIHRLWKTKLVSMIPAKSNKILDVASGTADVAIKIKQHPNFQEAEVILCDINSKMLDCGRARMIDNNLINKTAFVAGDAQNLPYCNDIFDCYIIAFGIRNVPDISVALKEAFRVLKPGGKFLCLELSMVDQSVLSKLYDLYSFNVIPFVGNILTKKRDAYQYLVESIRTFPRKEEFKNMIKEVGFKRVAFESMTFGVAAIHCGYK